MGSPVNKDQVGSHFLCIKKKVVVHSDNDRTIYHLILEQVKGMLYFWDKTRKLMLIGVEPEIWPPSEKFRFNSNAPESTAQGVFINPGKP